MKQQTKHNKQNKPTKHNKQNYKQDNKQNNKTIQQTKHNKTIQQTKHNKQKTLMKGKHLYTVVIVYEYVGIQYENTNLMKITV